jgi:hypothetical protein
VLNNSAPPRGYREPSRREPETIKGRVYGAVFDNTIEYCGAAGEAI